MRKCLRCDEIIIEDYMLKTDNFTATASKAKKYKEVREY